MSTMFKHESNSNLICVKVMRMSAQTEPGDISPHVNNFMLFELYNILCTSGFGLMCLSISIYLDTHAHAAVILFYVW